MHVRTLLFANALVFAILAAAMILVWRGNPRVEGLSRLARVHVAMMAGTVLIGLEPGVLPAYLSMVAGNALVILSVAWLLEGFRGLFDLRRDRTTRVASLRWISCLLFFLYIQPSLRARLLTTSLVALVLLLRAAWTARLGLRKPDERAPSLLLLSSVGLLALLGWGATDEEVHGSWPGDEMTPDAVCQATRAVTIYASADEIWPWLVQIGQDRGGFYSYTWLENLFGARMRNADRLLPDLAVRQVGDTVWMTPKERYGGKGCMRIAALEPGRSMVLVSPDDYETVLRTGRAPGGCWTFILRPLDNGITRLILRSRGAEDESLLGKLFDRLVFDPAHFIMERKMMLEIKRRAEGRLPGLSAAA